MCHQSGIYSQLMRLQKWVYSSVKTKCKRKNLRDNPPQSPHLTGKKTSPKW